VGAVLLQWEEGEQHPHPVCFLSRKLQGEQWHYDACNGTASACQLRDDVEIRNYRETGLAAGAWSSTSASPMNIMEVAATPCKIGA
jgi:hypothetical protein